jgi:hypothetical protein
LFTTKQGAEDYERKARLKSYSEWCGRGRHAQYRAKSLLASCCHAYVAYYYDDDLPIDPVFP